MKKNELKYGTILSYIYLAIYNLSQLVYTPILLKNLGNNLYGVYSLCISIVSYFTLLDFGLGNAIIRYATIYKEKKSEERNSIHGLFFSTYCFLGLLALIIGIIISLNITNFFSSSFSTKEIEIAQIIVIILTINVSFSLPLGVFSSIITAYQKFIFLKIANIIKTILSTIIMILFLVLGYKAITVSIITTISNLIYLIIITIYAIKKLKIKLSFKIKNKKIIKEIFTFSIFSFILLFIDKINMNVDSLILGKISTPDELTIYSISSRIYQVYVTLCCVICGMLLPKYTKLVEEKKYNELNCDFLQKSKWQLLIATYISMAFIIFGNNFINIWLGNNYYKSYIITSILMLSTGIPLSLDTANVILQAKNKQQFRAIILTIILILNIIISIPFCNKYGAIGCTVGTAITYILGHLIIMGIYHNNVQKLDMKSYFKNVFNIFKANSFVILIIIIINYFHTNAIINFIFLIMYLILSSIFNYIIVLDKEEKKSIINFRNKIMKINNYKYNDY